MKIPSYNLARTAPFLKRLLCDYSLDCEAISLDSRQAIASNQPTLVLSIPSSGDKHNLKIPPSILELTRLAYGLVRYWYQPSASHMRTLTLGELIGRAIDLDALQMAKIIRQAQDSDFPWGVSSMASSSLALLSQCTLTHNISGGRFPLLINIQAP